MTKNEYKFIGIVWIILFLIYYVGFYKTISFHESLIIGFVSMTVLKSVYDILYKTGYTSMYVYSEETNQRLRFLVLLIPTMVTIFYHYMLFFNPFSQ